MITTDLTESERAEIRRNAEKRLHDLRRLSAALWESRDDPRALTDLSTVRAEIEAAEHALERSAHVAEGRPTGSGETARALRLS